MQALRKYLPIVVTHVQHWTLAPEGGTALLDHLADVLARHRPFRIYDDCGHDHFADDEGVFEAAEIGLVCADGYLYPICQWCCCDAPDWPQQSERCVDGHDHVASPVCRDYASALRLLDALDGGDV